MRAIFFPHFQSKEICTCTIICDVPQIQKTGELIVEGSASKYRVMILRFTEYFVRNSKKRKFFLAKIYRQPVFQVATSDGCAPKSTEPKYFTCFLSYIFMGQLGELRTISKHDIIYIITKRISFCKPLQNQFGNFNCLPIHRGVRRRYLFFMS